MYSDMQISAIKKWIGSGSVNIFGRPFSGKDAQGKRLADLLDGKLVGGGEILRHTPSDHIKQHIDNGQLIPSNDYADIVLPYLSQPELSGKPLILSAVGRWHGEETAVIDSLEKSNHQLRAVIYLNISNDDSYNRWFALQTYNDRLNRHDDTESVLQTRFAEFQNKTMPVIDYYDDLGILIQIDGRQTRDEVTSDIIAALAKLATNN
jgi:adenylate kinase